MKRKLLMKIISSTVAAASIISMLAVTASAAEATADTVNELPSSYSSAELGYTTPVKRQSYNDCWAYAALATYESKLLRNGIETESMSVDHLNLWATTRSNKKGWIRNYSSDGYASIALGYLTSWQGGVTVSDAEGLFLSKNLKGDMVATDLARYGVTGVKFLSKDNPDEIKQAIIDNGGVYTSYSHSASLLSSDGLSYYMPPDYGGSYTGHAVEVVGWDDNYSAANFSETPENNGAWLIKNSWGDNNSLHGYFWISYEDKNIFDKKYKPSYAITDIVAIDDSVALIQNEIFGATYEFGYVKENDLTFLNQFSFDSDYQVLDKVVFKTECKGADYSIYFVPNNGDAPDADASTWTELYSGTVDYAGYICTDIDDFELSDSSGSIAIRLDTSSIASTASLGVGEWLVKSGTDTFVFQNESEKNQSYLYSNGKLEELMDWYLDNEDDELGGTFVIKAITTKKPYEIGDVNFDRLVNVADATEIQRKIAGIIDFTDEQTALADVNGDGKINIADATQIQRIVAGLV